MARLTRSQLLYDGCYAHIISRSIGKNKIFRDAEDFDKFLRLISDVKLKSGFKLFHYCVMHTHFHLAVMIPAVDAFSKAMQRLKTRYTCEFHLKYSLCGPIWRERYRSLLIENEAYLYACGLYIENNPVEAGLVQKSIEWKYCSSRCYCLGEENALVDGYGRIKLPYVPRDVNILDKKAFEEDVGIGSSYFRFQISDSRRQNTFRD